jgi:dTDP-glucose pyrophosphorylase/predicted transcriptional regulator
MFVKNLKSSLVLNKDTIKKCILLLVRSGHQIIFVTNIKKQLIGSITDGDIRRALLNKNTVDDKIKNIYNKKPFKCSNSTTYAEAEKIMVINNINHLPVVNKNNVIQGFFKLSKNKNYNNKNCEFIIMAGGRGERLMPLTLRTPKPMLKINGSPILETIIYKAKNFGFSDFYISINYLGNVIRKYFKGGDKHNCSIKYINEKKPQGTIGSIGNIKKKLNHKNVIIVNGDVVSDINYESLLKFHENNNADATMAVYPYKMQNPYGEVVIKGQNIIKINEKPVSISYVNSGVYVFKNEILKFIKKNCYMDAIDLINLLKKKKRKIIAFAIHENWVDVGLKNEYLKIKNKK